MTFFLCPPRLSDEKLNQWVHAMYIDANASRYVFGTHRCRSLHPAHHPSQARLFPNAEAEWCAFAWLHKSMWLLMTMLRAICCVCFCFCFPTHTFFYLHPNDICLLLPPFLPTPTSIAPTHQHFCAHGTGRRCRLRQCSTRSRLSHTGSILCVCVCV